MRVIERKQRVHGTPEKAKRDREEAIQLKRKRMESFEDACREFEGVPKAVGEPSAHREPPLGEISGNIIDFHFFRFLIVLYIYLDVYIAKKASSIILSLIWHTVRSYDEIAI